VVFQVRQGAVDMVGAKGAAHAAFFPPGTEHEVRDDKLTPPCKQIREAFLSAGSIEDVGFLDLDPGQFPPLAIDLVTLTGKKLLFGEQLFAG
jgi:hypothetical protein